MSNFLDRLNSHLSEDSVSEWAAERGLDMTYLSPILQNNSNTVVVSCAGSGKTTALSMKVVKDKRDTPAATQWVGTFLRKGKDDLLLALREVDPTWSGKVSTIHAELYSLYRELVFLPCDVISDSQNLRLLVRVLKDLSVFVRNEEDLFTFLTAYRNNPSLTVPSEYKLLPIDQILNKWAFSRAAKELVDFEDIQQFLLQNLDKARQLTSNRYSHIYLDEFQDVSRVQYRLLSELFEVSRKFVVGDDDQSIYSWRGASSSILKEVVSDWGCSVFYLPKNYRCPSGILDAVIPFVEKTPNRFPKKLEAFKDGGEIEIVEGSLKFLGTKLLNLVEKDLKEGLSVAVLSRTNADLDIPAVLCSSLTSYSVSYTGIGSNPLESVFGLFDPDFSVQKQSRFLSQLTRVKSAGVSRYLRYCSHQGYSPYEGLLFTPLDDLAHSIPGFLPLARDLREKASKTYDVEILRTFRDSLRDKYPDNDSVEVFEAVLHLCDTLDKQDLAQASSYLSYLWGRCQVSLEHVDVELSTVHSYKGLEADSVYVWDVSEGVFPYHLSADYEEERRIFYIACTRPRKKLTLLARAGKHSPYLQELDIPDLRSHHFML